MIQCKVCAIESSQMVYKEFLSAEKASAEFRTPPLGSPGYAHDNSPCIQPIFTMDFHQLNGESILFQR